MKPERTKAIATLVIRGLPDMTNAELDRLFRWLESERDYLAVNRREIANRYDSRLYPAKPKATRKQRV